MQEHKKHTSHKDCGRHFHSLSNPSEEVPIVSLIDGIIYLCNNIKDITTGDFQIGRGEDNLSERLVFPTSMTTYNCRGDVVANYRRVTARDLVQITGAHSSYTRQLSIVLGATIFSLYKSEEPSNEACDVIYRRHFDQLLDCTSISSMIEVFEHMRDELLALEEE